MSITQVPTHETLYMVRFVRPVAVESVWLRVQQYFTMKEMNLKVIKVKQHGDEFIVDTRAICPCCGK